MIWKVFTNKFSRALNIAILDLEHAILFSVNFFYSDACERERERVVVGGGGGGIDSIRLVWDRVNKLVSKYLSFWKSSLNVLLPDRCHGITRHLVILFNTDVLEKPTR